MRLTDTFIIQNLRVINEAKSNGLIKIQGIFQRADEQNSNKRIYPKAILEREVAKLQEAIQGQRLLGELDHPEYDSVKLSNVSHKITSLKMKGNDVLGEAVILNTPAGKVFQNLIEGGVIPGISSRGLGTTTPLEEGSQVNEDFNLVTFDLVADPSTKGAFPSLMESKDVSKIVRDTVNSITEKNILVKKLKDSLKTHQSDVLVEGRLPDRKRVASIRECIQQGFISKEDGLKQIVRNKLKK
jgi:hypothetical protein